MRRVTIQGVAGCFHEAAARAYFEYIEDSEPCEVIECETFTSLFDRLAADRSLMGITAIENTIAGSLLQNHELLRQSRQRIVGEYKLRISHVVAALEQDNIEDISEVNSHPIALMQCGDWLNSHPQIKAVEKDDTAGSAKMIKEQSLSGHAAICGEYAAELYGLKILQRGVETNKRNFTRFLILADESCAEQYVDRDRVNKASLVFSLPHSTGSLSKVLTILSFYDINLTKLQSLPIVGCEWEYLFYVDVTFSSLERYHQSLEALRPLTNEFKNLGEYVEYPNPAH